MTMTQTRTDAGQLLRFALKFDAVVSGLNGIAYLAGAGLLAGELGLPVTLLVSLGAPSTIVARERARFVTGLLGAALAIGCAVALAWLLTNGMP